jgi:hypothetical protein
MKKKFVACAVIGVIAPETEGPVYSVKMATAEGGQDPIVRVTLS